MSNRESESQGQGSLPIYDESFLVHHAGSIIDDPAVAMTELVA